MCMVCHVEEGMASRDKMSANAHILPPTDTMFMCVKYLSIIWIPQSLYYCNHTMLAITRKYIVRLDAPTGIAIKFRNTDVQLNKFMLSFNLH